MNYPATLESKLSVKNQESTLGAPKSEQLIFFNIPGGRRQLTVDANKVTINVLFDADEEKPDAVVISTDHYEIKYKDEDDCEKTTWVEYQPTDCDDWIKLKSAHVFKARGNVVNLDSLKTVKFRVTPKNALVDQPVMVQVFIGTLKKEKETSNTAAAAS